MLYYQVVYNLSTTCFSHFTWPSPGLYLAYRGLYYITSVPTERRDLFTIVRNMNSINRMVPIYAIYILCTIFYSVTVIMFVNTVLNGEVAGWCHSLLSWLHCHGHGVVDDTQC